MATDREVALEIALVSVVKAAQKQGVDLKSLLDLAAEVVSGFPQQATDREDRIASACLEISNAHTAILTGGRVKAPLP